MQLLILNYEYPPLGGGAGICARHQAEGLAASGHDVTVLSTWYRGEEERQQKDRFTLIRLKSMRRKAYRSNPLEMLSWAFMAFRFIRRNRVYRETDLVLAHFSLPGGLVALPLKYRYKIPYIIISHGQDIPWFCPRELFFYHVLFYLPIRWICSGASGITVLSQRRLRDLNSLMGRRRKPKHHIIPNGCDTEYFHPAGNEKNQDTLRILFTGRMTHQKDPFTMLKAVGHMVGEGFSFQLEIVGNGPLLKRMKRYSKKRKLDRHLRFSGWVPKDTLKKKYQEAHVLVITSIDEGMSLAMLEAMASGLYVITTAVSGSESLILENVNGNSISFRDPEQLSNTLQAFYRDKVLQTYHIPDNSLEKTRGQISWVHYVEAYNHLIQSCESST